MGANSVTYGTEELLVLSQKGNKALSLLGEESRIDLLPELDKAIEAFKDGIPFEVSVLAPKNFRQFLVELQNPTQPLFDQMTSEIPWWILLNQIEAVCFWQPDNLVKARSFISGLWQDEIVTKGLFKPPEGWGYFPPDEAISAFRDIFGSDMRAGSVLSRTKLFEPWEHSKGVAVWPSLSFLFRYFEIPKQLGISEKVKPWDETEDSQAAYAKIVELLLPVVGRFYEKITDYPFRNWREDTLTAEHIWLTPACRRAWQKLESMGDDDFVVAQGNSGFLYAGYSQRRSRLEIVLAGQVGQDCIMAGSTLAVQPKRLTAYEHLCIDCPGNVYTPDADGRFGDSLYFHWDDGALHFHCRWAGIASRDFGSAVASLR